MQESPFETRGSNSTHLSQVLCIHKAEAVHLVLSHPPAQRIQQQLPHNGLRCSSSSSSSSTAAGAGESTRGLVTCRTTWQHHSRDQQRHPINKGMGLFITLAILPLTLPILQLVATGECQLQAASLCNSNTHPHSCLGQCRLDLGRYEAVYCCCIMLLLVPSCCFDVVYDKEQSELNWFCTCAASAEVGH
jgi:hypothetical protein